MSLFSRKPKDGSAERARMGREVSARLQAAPGGKRAPIEAAEMYLFENWLNDQDCATLVRLIDEGRRPSTLLAVTEDEEFRNSESCDLDRWSPEVRPIDERIARLLGSPLEYGETMQGQRYAPGQQFKAHCDYFHIGQPYWPAMQASGGQRTWTAMIYLNDVEEGGATWFPRAGIRVAPKKGLLVVWNNMSPDGSPNQDTLHEGMRVIAGTKYIITKWFRERAWIKSDVVTY